MIAAVMLLLLQDSADEAIKSYEKAFAKARTDNERAQALSHLSAVTDKRVLKIARDLLARNQGKLTRLMCVNLLKNFPEEPEAADAVAQTLKSEYDRSLPARDDNLICGALEALSGMSRPLARKHVERINAFLRDAQKAKVTIPTSVRAIEAAVRTRDASSVEPLIDLITALQTDLKGWIQKEYLKSNSGAECDRDCTPT